MGQPATSARKRSIVATVPSEEILPVVDGNYESSVRGIFVIGDVTGLPLVKVAANQGVEVIEKMERRGAFAVASAEEESLDLVIVGAGPAGLSAAVEAQKRRLKYVVLERSRAASTICSFPPGKKVYSEPRFLKNTSELPVEGDRVKDDFLDMVTTVLEERGINIKEATEVRKIEKRGGNTFHVETSDSRVFRARNVIVAVGRQGQPRLLDVPGSELSHKVTYRFHTPDDYSNKDILVVGGGNSAVEAALMLCDWNRVTLSYRRQSFFRLKEENQRRVDEAAAAGRLTILYDSKVTEVREEEVVLDVSGSAQTIPNDNVVTLIGTLPPIEFLMDTGLELDGIWTTKRVIGAVIGLLVGCFIYFGAKHFELQDSEVEGVYYIPGFSWIFEVVPTYFSNLYGFYYLLYFSLIAIFGFYWAARYPHRAIWRRNLTLVLAQWTLWWGIPTGLVILLGRNVWTPLLMRSLNAWPLNMTAFRLEPSIAMGDPEWWYIVGFVGVVWAAILTFVVLPVFTVLVGKHYCSHICSCAALAETVGNSFRHRGPKGDWARRLEVMGFVVLFLASAVAVLELLGVQWPFENYNVWFGTFLAGAVGVGLYPFLGQRIWCRYWCPLAFWLNFWGRWSRFKITPEPGKCIDCNVCNQYCQMGIDIKTRALQGVPVTLVDTPCVACAECVARCPMEILHLGELPVGKLYQDGTDAGPNLTVASPVHDTLDFPRMNEKSLQER